MNKGCGKVTYIKDDQGISEEEIAPWYVKIFTNQFHLESNKYRFLCGGSMIAPNVVISAAHCFWYKVDVAYNQTSIDDILHKITIGKYQHDIEDNNITQKSDIKKIYLADGYNGKLASPGDISILILANNVWNSKGITPVCIDWNGKYNVHNGDRGKMAGWENSNDSNSSIFLERWFPYVNHSTCLKLHDEMDIKYVSYDRFCAGSKLGQSVGPKNDGTGISFLHSNSYFLTGIMVVRSEIFNGTIPGFTDIKYHIEWIRGILNKHVIGDSCVLPTVEGVVYSYEGSNESLSHGTLINHHTTVIENCELGYHKAYPKGLRFCLGKGKWFSNSDKLCFKMCPPLVSDSLDIKCSHNGKYANCSNLSIPDTIAMPSCKSTYTAPNGQQETPLELHCLPNGMWNNQLYRCNPYCGRLYIKNKVLINNGEKAFVGTAPWNVGIYRLKVKNHDLICGGSIIAPNLVVSAAHCFWENGMLSTKISIDDGLYKIAVGKYNRNFSVIDNDFTQIINVEIIHLPEGYYGSKGFHAEDIAVVVLQNKISFSNGVSPVCIDWNGIYKVVNGDRGKVVGWGRTEKGIQSPILLEASLPYIDHSSCRKMYTNGFEPFVTVDKFCAGSELISGQGVDVGDSGAGLCFLHSDFYYLTGIVSVKDPETNNSIATFTDVKFRIQWIRGLYIQHNQVQ